MAPLYVLRGVVAHGARIGRQMGFPTVNIAIDEPLPPRGVYVSRVMINGAYYAAITNIGVCPTVSSENKVRSESFILDFSADLYGSEIEIELYAFLRDEKKFASLAALQAEIEKNALQAREFFKNNDLL